jgi:porphobilinogen synthase
MTDHFKLDLTQRPRRLRRTASLRSMVEETVLRPADFVAPLFVIDGKASPEPIGSMPGVRRMSIGDAVKECRALAKLGVRAVALFPKLDVSLKDAEGSAALSEDALILRAVRAVKRAVPELTVITDIALDPYTTHGHDGVLSEDGREVANDRTVKILSEMAVLHARAGVDLVAPSDMMDGRVGAIRRALDAAGFEQTGIMAYSVKFASAYYGPFREAVGSARAAGTAPLDKTTYQMNPANRREALRELELDDAEGADILMVKPAGAYLDVIALVRGSTHLPVAAYQVSGEYSMLKIASEAGVLQWEKAIVESLIGFKRAGAAGIFTYAAIEVADMLK